MGKKLWTKSSNINRLRTFMDMGLPMTFKVAIDGGANIGAWTYALAAHFRKVIAFEPGKEAFGVLVKNTTGWTNIECHHKALMNTFGFISMKAPPGNDAMKARYVDWDDDGRVQAITIDSLELRRCGLIKLDLEGAEALALDGAVETIARCRPALVVEIQHSARFGIEPEAVHQKVLDMGYREAFRDAQDRFYVYGDE